jgi:TonB family protein
VDRWSESPFVLSVAGTFAIHMIFVVCADAIVVTHPIYKEQPAPHIDIVDIEPVKVIKPPPPPVQQIKPAIAQPVIKQARVVRSAAHEPPPITLPKQTAPAIAPSGGAPIVRMPDIAPSASGVGVAKGPRTTGHIGRGGTGEGTGAGIGSGAETAPMSVATIKTRAMPRGDYGYFSAGKDYPAEAKQLGIEGAIRVRLIVDETGRVKSSILLNHLGHGLDELALDRAKQIEFTAALDSENHPVSSVVIWTFNMTLPK